MLSLRLLIEYLIILYLDCLISIVTPARENMMSTPPDYSALVAQAEKAVNSVKDPELKRIAFQKILDDLIGNTSFLTTSKKIKDKKKTRQKVNKGSQSAKGGPQNYVEELVEENYFKKPQTIANVKAELENRGHHIPLTSLSGPLQKLCQRKILRRERIKETGKKQTFAYSEW
jgi:hypothetical protein